MPMHPIYSELTGATRLRAGLFGRLVVQVETVDLEWRDATARDLRNIGFVASSDKGRKRAMLPASQRPPRGWDVGTDTRLAWE